MQEISEGLGFVPLVASLFAPLFLVIGVLYIPSKIWRPTIHPAQSTLTEEGAQATAPPLAMTECPICLQTLNWPAVTTCGHSFCTRCIHAYWSSQATETLACPCCRRRINLLLDGRRDTLGEGVPVDVQALIDEFNAANGQEGSGSIIEQIFNTPRLLRVLVRQFSRDPVTVLNRVILTAQRLRLLKVIVLLSIYVLSPFDLMPEAILGVPGLIDDVVAVLMVLIIVAFIWRVTLVRHSRAQR